jgi:kynurenine formamidase
MKIIDLSHKLCEDTPVYPGDVKTGLTLARTLGANGCNAYLLRTGLHTGTHIDMPMHMLDDPMTAADFPPQRFIGPGVLLDARGDNPVCIKPECENAVTEGCIVLLYTGFEGRFTEPDYYTGYPEVSIAFAEFLIKKKVKMLGLDAPSPDYAPFAVHKLLLSNGVFILENLINLDSLADVGSFTVYAPPLKLAAEASPVRALAVVN